MPRVPAPPAGHTSPRVFRVVALPAPSEREQTLLYYQSYIEHFLSAFEIALFDWSWNNRLGVERVMGCCTDEQTKCFEQRIEDPRKVWKLSPMDLESHERWYDYSRARDAMFSATDTEVAPWNVIRGDNKKSARLNCISHLLASIPHQTLKRDKVTLPKRQKRGGYRERACDFKFVEARFDFN